MAWIETTQQLPSQSKKYLIVIDCDGILKESYGSFNVKRQMFHFDMSHINWRVVAWFDAPAYDGVKLD
jgi:hypothetical protein